MAWTPSCPIARWNGYGGESNPNGSSFESITWACGRLVATQGIGVFATIHVPLIHPLVAAKQLATVDHIGQGRLGVNAVCGWNEDEFQMFGVQKKEHDDRYEQGDEWWRIVKRIWAGQGAFDFPGVRYQLAGVITPTSVQSAIWQPYTRVTHVCGPIPRETSAAPPRVRSNAR